jgi:hypothetical protein
MDGILGIGRGVDTEEGVDAPQVMDSLKDESLIGSKLYGIHLSRSKDGLNDGELNLGEANKDRYSGDLNWIDCVPNDTGFWEIPIDDATVNGKTLGLSGKKGIMDTGTSYILMPPADALAIHSQISGYIQSGETFSLPCDTKVPLQFVFGKTGYNISTSDWLGGKLDSGLCRSNIVGRQTFNESQWLIGDVFLKNVYSVFDFEESRVGLGTPPTEQEQSSSSSSSSSATATPVSTGASKPSGSGSVTQTAAVEGSPDPSSTSVAESQGQSAQQDSAVGLVKAPLALVISVVALSMFI